MSPLFIKEMFSYANVENVVNPPQNPVANSKVCGEFKLLFFIAYPKTNPSIKHPITLEIKVGAGNFV